MDILIVGGGFAGLNAALAAARVANGRLKIGLVSPSAVIDIRPRLYEVEPDELQADLQAPLSEAGVAHIADFGVDVSYDSLILKSGRSVPFRRLVVATGSVMSVPAIAGVEHAYSIDNVPAAIRFDRRLKSLRSKSDQVIAIVGAGFTGIELALEMRDRISFHSGFEAGETARVLLIDRHMELGAELGVGPRAVIEQATSEARVEKLLGAGLSAIEATGIRFEDGRRLAVDAVVLCTGLRPAAFLDVIPEPKDTLGRLLADEFLRLPSRPSMFAAGDAVCGTLESGRTTLFSCQHALTLGKFAGENAGRDLLGLPLLPYRHPRYVTCLALGRSGAFYSEGWDRIPLKTGADAKAIKTRINRRSIYPPQGTKSDILAANRI
jgi:NADH:quinone reductase (non-electrogenic)